jgi:predicted membrane-bound dolichyl-phosphate-mannose-protein mannosyltransferase
LKSTCWEWWLQLRTFARFCVDVSINVFAHTHNTTLIYIIYSRYIRLIPNT